MTSQITDTVIFRADNYSLIGMSRGYLAHPSQFGMMAFEMHTACYRGYYATYEIREEMLYLQEMTINEIKGKYLPIDDISPVIKDSYGYYKDLNKLCSFTGKLRIAKGFIQEFYVHMGFQKPTAFETVLDIALENGCIIEVKDRSQDMKQKRGAFKKRYNSDDEGKLIGEAFQPRYES